MTINTARKLLGTYASTMTDEQVQALLSQLYGLADLITDQVLTAGSNVNSGVIDPNIRKEENGN